MKRGGWVDQSTGFTGADASAQKGSWEAGTKWVEASQRHSVKLQSSINTSGREREGSLKGLNFEAMLPEKT